MINREHLRAKMLGLAVVSLLLAGSIDAAEPPIARLYAQVLEEFTADFERVYGEQIVPILEKHGLGRGVEQDPPAPEGVLSRLVEFESTVGIAAISRALEADPTLQASAGLTGVSGRRLPRKMGWRALAVFWGSWRTVTATSGSTPGKEA